MTQPIFLEGTELAGQGLEIPDFDDDDDDDDDDDEDDDGDGDNLDEGGAQCEEVGVAPVKEPSAWHLINHHHHYQ